MIKGQLIISKLSLARAHPCLRVHGVHDISADRVRKNIVTLCVGCNHSFVRDLLGEFVATRVDADQRPVERRTKEDAQATSAEV